MPGSQRCAAYHQCGREPVRERTDTGVLTRETKVPETGVDVRSLYLGPKEGCRR